MLPMKRARTQWLPRAQWVAIVGQHFQVNILAATTLLDENSVPFMISAESGEVLWEWEEPEEVAAAPAQGAAAAPAQGAAESDAEGGPEDVAGDDSEDEGGAEESEAGAAESDAQGGPEDIPGDDSEEKGGAEESEAGTAESDTACDTQRRATRTAPRR